jgi:hypothetical protein
MTNPLNERTPPKGITIERTNDGITIIKKWLDWEDLYTIIFAIVWDTAMIKLGIPSLLSLGSFLDIFSFLTMFLLASIYTYVAFVACFNKTQIVVNDREIIVSYGPLPMLGQENKQLKASKLKRLYSYKKRRQNAEYQVRAETHTGADKSLVTLGRRREALFVIITLEDYFNTPYAYEPR